MAESEAPRTRGFLFADLRGYTRFVEIHGDKAASELLSAYRTLVRAAVARFSGAEIKTEGDGFYVVFPSASSAIRCALAILEQAASSTAAAGGPLAVGIGIHAGETEDSAEGFVGSAVNIAARVCAQAGSGELLVTETVRSLVRTSMPLTIEPRGRRRLKGIREPIALVAIRPSSAARRSRGHRLRSVAARSLERRPVVAGFAALAGVAAVATVVLATGLLAGVTAHRSSQTAMPRATSSAGATPSPSGGGPYPNAAERTLLGRLNSSTASFCRRAATSEYPLLPKSPLPGEPVGRLPVQAGLRCPLGGAAPDVVFLWAVAPKYQDLPGKAAYSTATVDTYFFRRVADLGAPVGDCAKDDLAYMDWSFGPLAGKLLCFATPARARMDWTFEGEDVIATAERDDGDRAALYRWWLETGRSILH